MGEMTQKRNKDTDSDIVDLIQKVNIKKSMLENYLRDKSKFITEKPMLSWAMQVQSTFELYLKNIRFCECCCLFLITLKQFVLLIQIVILSSMFLVTWNFMC